MNRGATTIELLAKAATVFLLTAFVSLGAFTVNYIIQDVKEEAKDNETADKETVLKVAGHDVLFATVINKLENIEKTTDALAKTFNVPVQKVQPLKVLPETLTKND